MTYRDALTEGSKQLKQLDTPLLDASLLLGHICGLTREDLYVHFPDKLDADKFNAYSNALIRRLSGEPVAWITGLKEFWGLPFHVGQGVLCPRPDSELLVETALEIIPFDLPYRMHDCCTGPGTLAVAIASERSLLTASASDISDIASYYFTLNNKSLAKGRIRYTKTNLLEGIEGPFDMIIANPPYLTPEETVERMEWGWKEPEIALNGGGEYGLDIISLLIRQAVSRLADGGIIILEANPLQMPAIRYMLAASGFLSIVINRDYGGHDRVIMARLGGDS